MLRTDYYDIEDYCQIHVTFTDGTVADIFSTEVVLGGVHNWLEVFANNHRTRCNINPIDALTTYNPREEIFQGHLRGGEDRDQAGLEQPGARRGMAARLRPGDAGLHRVHRDDGRPQCCGAELGYDTVAVLYSGYLSAAQRGGAVVPIAL